ncbi:hypothetical protein ACK8OR_09210 [Jannaschia sp. KMU-145]|uniref:hypothetical protein n=1 Tax=Jannaschia halovivens TaxID=3388667 RepID=UPI00396B115B
MGVRTKIRFVDAGVLDEIVAQDNDADITDETDVMDEVQEAADEAGRLLGLGKRRVEAVFAHNRLKNKKAAWKSDPVICRYFGDSDVTRRQMRLVRRRLRRAHRRTTEGRLRIRLRSQSKASKTTTRGRNSGGVATPRIFQLYPRWFAASERARAGILAHELFHDWSKDHDVTGDPYSIDNVLALARDEPKKARRNPENFEQFILALA